MGEGYLMYTKTGMFGMIQQMSHCSSNSYKKVYSICRSNTVTNNIKTVVIILLLISVMCTILYKLYFILYHLNTHLTSLKPHMANII